MECVHENAWTDFRGFQNKIEQIGVIHKPLDFYLYDWSLS